MSSETAPQATTTDVGADASNNYPPEDFSSIFVGLYTTGLQAMIVGIHNRYSIPVLDAEEIVYDAACKAFEQQQSYTPGPAPMSAWLWKIAIFDAIDWIRDRSRIVEYPLDDLHDVPAAAPGVPTNEWNAEPTVRKSDPRTAVLGYLAQINPRHREIITLYYENNYSLPEIAAELNTTPGVIKTTLYRIRNTLRERMAQDELSA